MFFCFYLATVVDDYDAMRSVGLTSKYIRALCHMCKFVTHMVVQRLSMRFLPRCCVVICQENQENDIKFFAMSFLFFAAVM